MSSADGWLVEGESPKQAPGLCREKTAARGGRGSGLYPESRDRASYAPGTSLWRFPERGGSGIRRRAGARLGARERHRARERRASETKRIKDYTGA